MPLVSRTLSPQKKNEEFGNVWGRSGSFENLEQKHRVLKRMGEAVLVQKDVHEVYMCGNWDWDVGITKYEVQNANVVDTPCNAPVKMESNYLYVVEMEMEHFSISITKAFKPL